MDGLSYHSKGSFSYIHNLKIHVRFSDGLEHEEPVPQRTGPSGDLHAHISGSNFQVPESVQNSIVHVRIQHL